MTTQTQTHMDLLLLSLIACAGLLVVALFIVATVLIASRHSLVVWQKIKSALAVLVWVVPAAAVVALIGVLFQPQWVSQTGSEQWIWEPVSQWGPTRFQPQWVSPPKGTGGTAGSIGVAFQPDFMVGAPPPTSRVHAPLPTSTPPATSVSASSTASPPRLKVRQISSDDPKWTTASNIINGRELVPLSSERFATLAEAEENVTRMALTRIKQDWHGEATQGLTGAEWERRQQQSMPFPCHPYYLARDIQHWRTADVQAFVDLIDRYAVKDLVGEVMDWDFKNGTIGKMYRAHLRLDFSPEFRDAVQVAARGQLVEHRLMILGGMLGLVTLMLGTAAGYFKLDNATGGAYRRRLKLAAVAVIAAGGLATAQVLGS